MHEETELPQLDNSMKTTEASLILLSQMSLRIENIESSVAKISNQKPDNHLWIFEITKSLLGSWPLFGLAFLFLFFEPLYEGLSELAKRVKNSEDIMVGAISFKSAIAAEAKKTNSTNTLSLIPKLSAPAISLLLQGQKKYGTYIAGLNTQNPASMYFPNEELLASLAELEKAGLVSVDVTQDGFRQLGVEEARKAIANFKKNHPGQLSHLSEDTDDWVLESPLKKSDFHIGWSQTESGRDATKLIVRSVVAELTKSEGKPETK